MLKGCQRKMIEVKCRDKGTFETAYFVLRRDAERRPLRRRDLLEEANRIINENILPATGRRRCRRVWVFLLWLGGFLMGGGAVWLLSAVA